MRGKPSFLSILNCNKYDKAFGEIIFNIGNSNPINLIDFISILENSLGIEAIKDLQPIQPGDVQETAADTKELENWIGFRSYTSLKDGIREFSKWYREYYGV